LLATGSYDAGFYGIGVLGLAAAFVSLGLRPVDAPSCGGWCGGGDEKEKPGEVVWAAQNRLADRKTAQAKPEATENNAVGLSDV
jgi:hypothetical protein